MLIAKRDYEELVEVGAEPPPGIRTQIAAADYNDDGRVDLLLGDFRTTISPQADLTSAERQEMQNIRKQIDEASTGVRTAMQELRDDFNKRYPGEAIYSDKADEEWKTEFKKLKEGKLYNEREETLKRLAPALGKYLVKPEKALSYDEYATSHGYVWLFRRK